MSMTREQKKYWRKSAVHSVLCVAFCIGILWAASYLVNVVI